MVLEIVIVNYSPFIFFSTYSRVHANINAPILSLTKPHIQDLRIASIYGVFLIKIF